MKLLANIGACMADDRGAEVTELAIVLALIVAGAIAAIVLLGPKVQKGYLNTNSGLARYL